MPLDGHALPLVGGLGPLDQLTIEAEPSPALSDTVVPAIRRMITSGALPQGMVYTLCRALERLAVERACGRLTANHLVGAYDRLVAARTGEA